MARAIALGVEDGQLVARSASADQDHGIEVDPSRQRDDGRSDHFLGELTLDAGVDHGQ